MASAKAPMELGIDRLKHASNLYITTDNLRTANELLIKAQQKYWLTELFGKGERSGSDLQRFAVNKKSLLGSKYVGMIRLTLVMFFKHFTYNVYLHGTVPRNLLHLCLDIF